MFEFKPVSERMQQMHHLIRNRVIQNDAERALIITDVFQKNKNLVPMLRQPLVLKNIC